MIFVCGSIKQVEAVSKYDMIWYEWIESRRWAEQSIMILDIFFGSLYGRFILMSAENLNFQGQQWRPHSTPLFFGAHLSPVHLVGPTTKGQHGKISNDWSSP